jgi:hypothetical protein
VSNVVEKIPEEFKAIFTEVLDERDPELLSALRNQDKPTNAQREDVDDIFSDEIVRELGSEHVPTERGQRIKRAIEEFWHLWPSEVSLD